MTRRGGLLAAAGVTAALLSGCGGSSKTTGTVAPRAAPTATGTSSGTGTTPKLGKATAEACYRALRGQTSLPDETKKKLENVCAKAASGDREAFKKALQEACEEVINKASIPEGVDKQAALKACKRQ
jgi:hypothetical protein